MCTLGYLLYKRQISCVHDGGAHNIMMHTNMCLYDYHMYVGIVVHGEGSTYPYEEKWACFERWNCNVKHKKKVKKVCTI